MLRVPSTKARVFVRPGPTDLRKQVNGLAVLVEQHMEKSPFAEAVFVFCNRERRILKALWWDGNGFCLWYLCEALHNEHVLHPLREALRTETPEDGGVDLSAIRLTHYKIHRRREEDGLSFDPDGQSVLETPAVAQGTGAARDRKQALLSEIVEQMNQIFEGDLSDADVIHYAEGVRDKLMEDREVALQARNNASLDQFANGKIKQAIPPAIWEMRTAHQSMTDQVMADSETMKRFADVITRMVYEIANEGAG